MMRGLSAILAGVCVGVFAFGAVAENSFVGDWEIKQEFQGQERVSTLSITEADGKFAGSWASQRGTSELADVKVDGDKLTFVRTMKRQGQSFEMNCEATIVDGKLMGKMVTPRGEREFVGMAKSSEPTFVGSWDIAIDFQGQTMAAKLDVTEADGKVAGHWSSQLGDSDLEDIKIEDGAMTFSRHVSAQGQEMDLSYSAKLDGDKLAGTISSDMGEIPFTGTRAQAEAAGGTEAERAAALVKQLDGNGDDQITEDEAPEQMKQFFTMIDQNGDGQIDAQEMIMVIQFMDQQN